MTLPSWARDWRVLAGGGGLLALVGLTVATASRVGPPLPPGAKSGGLKRLDGSSPIVPVAGRTYFAVVTTHGSANLATVGQFTDGARAEGFRDVVVSGSRIPGWPGSAEGDYYIRGTFVGPAKRFPSYPRHIGVTLGSVDVRDVWESFPG